MGSNSSGSDPKDTKIYLLSVKASSLVQAQSPLHL